jgi:hypothetical protein
LSGKGTAEHSESRDGQPFVGNLGVTIRKGFEDVVDRLDMLIELQAHPGRSTVEITGASVDNPRQELQQVCLSGLTTIGIC